MSFFLPFAEKIGILFIAKLPPLASLLLGTLMFLSAMPSYRDVFSKEELDDIIAFLPSNPRFRNFAGDASCKLNNLQASGIERED